MRKIKLTPALLFGIVLVFYLTLKTHRSYIGQGDEPHYILVSQSLLLDRDLDLANNYESPLLKTFDSDDHHVVLRPDGIERPFHSIGLSLAGLPIYAVVYGLLQLPPERNRDQSWILTKNLFSISMMVLAAFMSVLLFRFYQTLFQSEGFAWMMALLTSLTPVLLSFGMLFFTEFPGAVILTYLFWRFLERRDMGWKEAFLIGFLPWLHPRYYLLAACLYALCLWTLLFEGERSRQRILNFARHSLLLAGLGIGVLALNKYLWGGFSPVSAYQNIPNHFDTAYLPIALPALFTDRSYGLFVFAPLYMLFPCGWVLLAQRNRRLFLASLFVVIPYLGTIAGFASWHGGWSPGARFLAPIQPLMALGVACFLFEAFKTPFWRRVAQVLIGGSFILTLLYWQKPKLLWNQDDGINLFFEQWLGVPGQWIISHWPNFMVPGPELGRQTVVFLAFILGLNLTAYFGLKRSQQ